MYGMNRILKNIGWAAVAVDGFIPPSIFMEFQAHKVLVIAEDIRSLEHIGYTPAPDIIHESAGHAPIIADEKYAEYLKYFGEIGSKAFSSELDFKIYQAVRYLSIIKEDSKTLESEIQKAEHEIDLLRNQKTSFSEMSQIRNLHWWTVEYGLIGELDNPKIYGAGLLSSIEESKYCLSSQVKKIPYSIKASKKSFDITKPQPQLFVTPDFDYLNFVLQEFAKDMAVNTGGVLGLEKACDYKDISTCVLDSGLQISGNLEKFICDEGDVIFLKTNGETAIAYDNQELEGQGVNYHKHGYSCPLGVIKGYEKLLCYYSEIELQNYGLVLDSQCELNFQSGIFLEGKLMNFVKNNSGQILLLQFKDCLIKYKNQVLFEPSWGIFDLAIGSKIKSVYPGHADYNSFKHEKYTPKHKTHKKEYSDKIKHLDKMYSYVSDVRSFVVLEDKDLNELNNIFNSIKINYKYEWLLCIELLELCKKFDKLKKLKEEIEDYLSIFKSSNSKYVKLIDDGVNLLK